jgi:hypothetical protein
MNLLYPPSFFPPKYFLPVDRYNPNAIRKASPTTIKLHYGSEKQGKPTRKGGVSCWRLCHYLLIR